MNNLSKYIVEKLKLNKDIKKSHNSIEDDFIEFVDDYLKNLDYIDFANAEYEIIYYDGKNPKLSLRFKSSNIVLAILDHNSIWRRFEKDMSELIYNGEKLFTDHVSGYCSPPKIYIIDIYLKKEL